jgi:hemerythrin
MVTDYTHVHFEIEEGFLQKCAYPEFKYHQELHNELKRSLFKTGSKSMWHQDPYEFLEFLKKWWIDHINDQDRRFRDYFLANAQKSEDGS